MTINGPPPNMLAVARMIRKTSGERVNAVATIPAIITSNAASAAARQLKRVIHQRAVSAAITPPSDSAPASRPISRSVSGTRCASSAR